MTALPARRREPRATASQTPPARRRKGMGESRTAAIMLTVLGINLFGDSLRDVLDPKLRDR